MVPAIPATANKQQARHAPHDPVSTELSGMDAELLAYRTPECHDQPSVAENVIGTRKNCGFWRSIVRDEANVEKGLAGESSDDSLPIP
jgi:hypothetical protein